mmetsp:Transcript_16079/g.16210  ORF Transcript_16079/g.16210 Transcript_16079/m.16210 type:complete len:425 (+) Transcript_16079:42-1316(+)
MGQFKFFHLLCTAMLLFHRECYAFRRSSGLNYAISSMLSSTISKSGISSEEKLTRLRQEMAKDGIDAFIIPTDDPHMSEYTAPFFERRRYISGFSGSAGTAVVTASKAYLWTDGRYFTQAEQELDNNWELMRYGMKDVPSPAEFLSKHLIKDSVIGVDPFVHAAGALTKLQEIIQPQHIKLKQIQMNPIDRIWEEDETDIRAAKPQGSLRVHPIDYAGQTVVEKLVEVRKLMNDSNVKGLVLTALDEIAWMTNIRGRDIPCNPVAIAYALITTENAILFIDSKKLSPEVSNHLSTSTITLKPYEDTLPTVQELASTLMTDNENERDLKEYIWMDDRTVNQALYRCYSYDSYWSTNCLSERNVYSSTERSYCIRSVCLSSWYSWLPFRCTCTTIFMGNWTRFPSRYWSWCGGSVKCTRRTSRSIS